MCIDHSSVTSRVKYPGYSFRSRHEGRDCPPKRESWQMLGVNGIGGGRVSWRRLQVSPDFDLALSAQYLSQNNTRTGLQCSQFLSAGSISAIGTPWLKPTQPLVNTTRPPHWLSVPVCFVHRSLDSGPSLFTQVPKSNTLSSICASGPALIWVNGCIITKCACVVRAWIEYR